MLLREKMAFRNGVFALWLVRGGNGHWWGEGREVVCNREWDGVLRTSDFDVCCLDGLLLEKKPDVTILVCL